MHYGNAEWFPDGHRILFTGNEPNQPPRTFAQDLEGGKPTPITPEGVLATRVSPNQQFVTSTAEGKLSLYPMAGGPAKVIAGLEPGESVIRWSGDGRFLFLKQFENQSSIKINRLEVSTGHKELWKELKTPDPVGVHVVDVVLTPDGAYYAYSFQRDNTTLFLVSGLK